jgi:hypothetical protein
MNVTRLKIMRQRFVLMKKNKTKARKKRINQKFEFQKLEERKLLAAGFAPIDGVGNNLESPELGSVGEQFIRIAPSDYEDGLNEPARTDEASILLSTQEESVVNDRFIKSMWFQWGQFLDHDINSLVS